MYIYHKYFLRVKLAPGPTSSLDGMISNVKAYYVKKGMFLSGK